MYYFSIVTDNTFLLWMRKKIWERHIVFKFKIVVEKFGRGCSWNFISSSNIDKITYIMNTREVTGKYIILSIYKMSQIAATSCLLP